MSTLLWFSHDLRLADHEALTWAARRGPVAAVFVLDPDGEGAARAGAAQRWWLHRSLSALRDDLHQRGVPLYFRAGSSLELIPRLAAELGVTAVALSRRPVPPLAALSERVARLLRTQGYVVEMGEGALLHDPSALRTGSGGPYTVFTPFWRNLSARLELQPPLPIPQLAGLASTAELGTLEQLELLPRIPWYQGMEQLYTPGEAGAQLRLQRFIGGALTSYADQRDIPGLDGTSRLAPHLHFGEVSIRAVYHAASRARERSTAAQLPQIDTFLRELGWREFAHHVLTHHPHTVTAPLRPQFANFPWQDQRDLLKLWQKGRTGYPIVDAGMRELWHTGSMHNRVRMIVASFLTKHLLIPWQRGAEWFWDTLLDADLANNTLGWQWAAGSGADAQPYFRIFNPISQGVKFDPTGQYVRRWLPELAALHDSVLHEPWTASPLELRAAGVALGRSYPAPIVDHATARARALAAFDALKAGTATAGAAKAPPKPPARTRAAGR